MQMSKETQSLTYKATRKIIHTLLEKLSELFTLLPRLCDYSFSSRLLEQVHSLQQVHNQKLFKTPISKLARHYQSQWQKMAIQVSRIRRPTQLRLPQHIFASLPPTRKASEMQPASQSHRIRRAELQRRLRTEQSIPTQFNNSRVNELS